MSGTSLRLGRLCNQRSGRSFMVAFDRTLSLGPEPYAVNAAGTISAIAEGGADAILMSPGLIKQYADLLAYRGGPSIVCRLDFPFLGAADRGRGEAFRLITSVEEAASLGADAVVLFHTLGYADKSVWADNVATLGRVVLEARAIGLPVIVEAVPWGVEAADPKDPAAVGVASRIAAELGADAVKTEYVGSTEAMRQVVEGCPVPLFVLGGPRVGVDDLLAFTGDALSAGASGVIYGRNVWQRSDSNEVSMRLSSLLHDSGRDRA